MRAIAVLLLILSGCSSIPTSRKPLPKVITLVWAKSAGPNSAVAAWEAQILRRWPDRDIAVVFCHGDDAKGHPWTMTPDAPMRDMPVENAAAMLHQIFPGRLLVFVTCNGGAAGIHTPGVAFSRKRVWTWPGKDRRWVEDDDGKGQWVVDTGNVWEFEVSK